jgi:ubiquinone/menaquinone biosynthesis C-methylase UbiE
MTDKWNNAELYESYVGRWSRKVAVSFMKWLDLPFNFKWIDVGCGTGALSEVVLKHYKPEFLIGVDTSESHIIAISENLRNFKNTDFRVADAYNTGAENNSLDVVISGLVLNFVPDVNKALKEFQRILAKNGTAAAYVWDYSDKMEMMRYFWDAAVFLFEDAIIKDESNHFNICNKDILQKLFADNCFSGIETTQIDVQTIFNDFYDYWNPFLSGIAPAPAYCMSLSEDERSLLKERIFNTLPVKGDGSIHLIARAIAVKGIKT